MSINDYEKWVNAFENNQIFNTKQTMDKFLSIGKFDNGNDVQSNLAFSGSGSYGFGMIYKEETRNNKTYKTIAHAGGMPGSASLFKKITIDNDSIWVIYFNNAGSYPEAFDLLEQAEIIF